MVNMNLYYWREYKCVDVCQYCQLQKKKKMSILSCERESCPSALTYFAFDCDKGEK